MIVPPMSKPSEKAMQAFDAFAAKYNHESNEWLDMGVDVYFCAGYDAAAEALSEHKRVIEMAERTLVYFYSNINGEEYLIKHVAPVLAEIAKLRKE